MTAIIRRETLKEPSVSEDGLVWIPGKTFTMGSDKHYTEEAPAHPVEVDGFWIDETPVTNRQFIEFVKATGYVTLAEKTPDPTDYPGALPHMLKAGSLMFDPPIRPVTSPDITQWWTFKFGADWRHPYGRRSDIRGKFEHPVVHVAFATPRLMLTGRARICQRRPSGNSPHAAGWSTPSLLGVTR